MCGRAVVLLLAAATVAVAAPVPKALKKRDTLDGVWVTTERFIGRQDRTKEPWVWEIKGEQLRTFSLNADQTLAPNTVDGLTLFPPDPKRPDELDFLHVVGTSKNLWRGRMTWDGAEFVICFGEIDKERPAEVTNGPAVYSYYRFKRMPEK
jgi:hypothetical protein